jgi:predicted dehydrogenase
MSTLRFGIIGCGGIARAHLKACQANGATVTAVADTDPEAAAKMAQEAGGAKAFTSADELFAAGLVDAVSICSPPCAHADAAVAALGRGIHVLLEKPIADTVASARRICAVAATSKATLMVAYRHRFLPAIQEIKRAVDAGTIGKPVLFHNTFCGSAFHMKDKWFSQRKISGGGTLMDSSSHSIDLFRYLIGEVTESAALMSRRLEGTDVEDVSAILLKSAGGTVGSLTASWVAGDGIAYVEVVGEQGRIAYNYATHELRLKAAGSKETVAVEVAQSNGFPEEMAHFIRCLEAGTAPMIGPADGLRGVEIIQGVYGKAKLP